MTVTKMGNWLLYIGIFLCCTGVGVIPGAILIFVWGITQITGKEATNTTINNYNFESEKYQAQLESDIQHHIDVVDTMQDDYLKSMKEYNRKKDAYSDDTREEMR